MMRGSWRSDNRGPGSAKHHAAKSGALHRARDTGYPQRSPPAPGP
jgi:hypothetical protein